MHAAAAAACQPKETDMSTLTDLLERPPVFLRRALTLDAAASGATGVLMIAGAGLVEGMLGLPAALLRGAGTVLVPYVAFVIYAGTRGTISGPAVWAIIVANVLWAAASALLLMSGWVAPTALGTAFVIAQAAVVALLGELQYMGLRRGVNRPMAAA
jgi:hypothetical protein